MVLPLLVNSSFIQQHPQAMRNQQQLLLLSSLSTLITNLQLVLLHALLLNAELAMPAGVASCSASHSTGTVCSDSKLTISFPFLTEDECHYGESNFIINNCEQGTDHPHWPGFTKYAMKDGPETTVINISIPLPQLTDSSNDSTGPEFDREMNGYIDLTWNTDLLDQISTDSKCDRLISNEQIPIYIPQSINLHDFAHSAFNLDSSNLILLFGCNTTQAESSSYLSMNSKACMAYANECPQQEYKCYQYMNPSNKELNLPQVMSAAHCMQLMFFVATDPSLPVSSWVQGLIRLNWRSMGTDWLASTFQACEACLSRNGSCGYNAGGDFQCYCNTGCAAPPTTSGPLIGATTDTACHGGLMHCNRIFKICLAVALSGVALTLAFLGFCRFHKLRKSFHDLPLRRRMQDYTHGPNLSIILTNLEGLTERPIAYSYSSIVSATKSFSHVVGEGGFGVVYKGTLSQCSTANKEGEGMQIAVKVLAIRSKHIKKQFLNEVSTIGRIHHVNVVRLLGFCVQKNHQMIVYEYVANGSLDRWLFGDKNGGVDDTKMLDWSQRYTIAVGVARGLSYLHEECRHRTVHCDIKPQNILLDEAMNPKIADFGLARLMGRDESRVLTLARGTPGYMAPEFWRGGEGCVSTKIDVYSYGMVLLELISGHRNFVIGDANMDSVCCFPGTAFEAAMQGNIGSIIDSRLGLEDEALRHQIWTATFVALWCIQDHPVNRPSMSEVVQYLDGKISISKNPPQPSMSFFPAHARTSHDRQDFTPISIGR